MGLNLLTLLPIELQQKIYKFYFQLNVLKELNVRYYYMTVLPDFYFNSIKEKSARIINKELSKRQINLDPSLSNLFDPIYYNLVYSHIDKEIDIWTI